MHRYPFVKENLEIYNEIGSGGTAQVYLAYDKRAKKSKPMLLSLTITSRKICHFVTSKTNYFILKNTM